MIWAPTDRATRDPDAVGADNAGIDGQRRAVAVTPVTPTARPAASRRTPVTVTPGHCPGRGRRVGHEGVEDVAPGGDQEVDAGLVLDRGP